MSPESQETESQATDAAGAVVLHPIGAVETDTAAADLPRHWSLSDVEGTLVLHPDFVPGLRGVEPGQRIVVLFHFDRSPVFEPANMLVQSPRHLNGDSRGVFSICSPRRPNPVGLSVVEVLAIEDGRLRVRGLDMMDGTPILDIKPHVEGRQVGG